MQKATALLHLIGAMLTVANAALRLRRTRELMAQGTVDADDMAGLAIMAHMIRDQHRPQPPDLSRMAQGNGEQAGL